MKILWLYSSNSKWNFNHWYQLDFVRVLKQLPNVEIHCYGYKLKEWYPDLILKPYDDKIIGLDLKKEFNFDVIIMVNKNRFFKKPGKRETIWLLPEFFKGLENTPKVFIEGDYHQHLRRPGESNWYSDRYIDLMLVRHLSALEICQEDIPVKWFPCSVDNTIFKPNPEIERKNKCFLIGKIGIEYYPYRNGAGAILEAANLAEISSKRLFEENYVKCLQSYVSHISGSSRHNITAAKMFEIMSSGSVLLTDEGDEYGLKELFPKGSYCTYKRDYTDVIKIAKQITEDKDFRNSITEKALKCINDKHSHIVRGKELISLISRHFKITESSESIFDKIKNFFSPSVEPVSPEVIELSPQEEPEKVVTELAQKQIEGIALSKEENLKILTKLNTKGIKVCLLQQSCYDIIINDTIGDALIIAVNDKIQANKITENKIPFFEFPKQTKLFEFNGLEFHLPCPVIPYLKTFYGEEIAEKLSKKQQQLKLDRNYYKWVRRK